MTEVLESLGLREAVLEVGLSFDVGLGGKRLSATQRQKLALARALVKRPDLMIVDEATSAMDGRSQTLVMENVLNFREGQGVIWFLHRARDAEYFDHVLVLQDGKIAEEGKFAELAERDSSLNKVLAAD